MSELTLKQIFKSSCITKEDLDASCIESKILGQEQALEALQFGLSMHCLGYNIFCAGDKGIGRTRLTIDTVKKYALQQNSPKDWCYIYNFITPYKPKAISFSSGEGQKFVNYMQKTIALIKKNLHQAFNEEKYKIQINQIEKKIKSEKQESFVHLKKKIESENVALIRLETGIAVAPVYKENILQAEDFNQLPVEIRKDILDKLQKAQKKLEKAVQKLPNLEGLSALLFEQLHENIIKGITLKALAPLRKLYIHNPVVLEYLALVEDDIYANISLIVQEFSDLGKKDLHNEILWDKYRVNLVLSHDQPGAPVVYLNNVSVPGILGKIEHAQHLGTVITDFMMIKPGALLKANEGYLIIDAKDLFTNPKAWAVLKECLFSRKIKFDTGLESASILDMISIEPDAIPLNVKIILIGDDATYFSMTQLDEAFLELFKVYVHFNSKIARTEASEKEYVKQLQVFAKRENLVSFGLNAFKTLIEKSSRMTDNQNDLTLYISKIRDIMREASVLAEAKKSKIVSDIEINQVLCAKKERFSFLQKEVLEQIERSILSLTIHGKRVGQLNALAVQKQGEFLFGRPNRITCQIRIGKGDFMDIEREVSLGGPIHSKGVLILSSFLASRFSMTTPLALDASLVFEQSYLPVDGDSASSAELYCLLSSIADVPLKQGIAVTGSVNQLGQVQAVGAVNEKIEGYFDVCMRLGLTGEQGVIIPKANIQNLMLKKELREAIKERLFHIYAVESVDEGIEILTGHKMGILSDKRSLNYKIVQRLKEFFQQKKNQS